MLAAHGPADLDREAMEPVRELVRGLQDQHHLLVVLQGAAHDDEAVREQFVHVRGVLGPGRLLAPMPGRVVAGAVDLVQHDGLFSYRPVTRKGPLIKAQPRGGSIAVTIAYYEPTWRRKVLGALIADVGFRRPQAAPIGGSFRPTGIDRDQFMTDAADSSLLWTPLEA